MRLEHQPTRDETNSAYWARAHVRDIELIAPFARRILDVGMGGGLLVQMLRAKGIYAVGVDLRRIAPEGLIGANARALPFRDGSFDVVVDAYTILDMIEFQQGQGAWEAVSEIKRVLKTGGYLLSSHPQCVSYEFTGHSWDGKSFYFRK